jgi:hypothetical protein
MMTGWIAVDRGSIVVEAAVRPRGRAQVSVCGIVVRDHPPALCLQCPDYNVGLFTGGDWILNRFSKSI